MATAGTLTHHDTTCDDQTAFRWSAPGWILTSLNLLAALNASYFFVARLGSGLVGWLMMNTCSPSIALFAAGYLARRRSLMVAGALMMARYGTGGLLVFGWSGPNLFAQVGHILMTLAVALVAVDVVRNRRWRDLAVGTALGVAILVPLTLLQGWWFEAHPGLLEQLFSGAYAGS
jgi:hypothetical protein